MSLAIINFFCEIQYTIYEVTLSYASQYNNKYNSIAERKKNKKRELFDIARLVRISFDLLKFGGDETLYSNCHLLDKSYYKNNDKLHEFRKK